MSISESLSGVSTELDKILKQLKDIKGVQDELGKGAADIGVSVGRGSGGTTSKPVSQGKGSFTTPPKPPGSQLGGITPTATGGGPGGGGGGSGSGGYYTSAPQPAGGSRVANAAMLGAAAVATAGYNLTPGIQDLVPFQSVKFGASQFSAGGYDRNYYGKVRAMFGGHQSDPMGAMTAANIATMSGQGMGTGNFSTVMRETATTSTIFGMTNAQTASGLSNMTSGSMAGRLAQYGIYVSSLSTGDSRGFGNLIDQIWRAFYGSSDRKIDYESVAGSIRGGYIGSWINKVFADDPYLREMVVKALLMKAQANGKRLDYKSLGPYSDGGTPMSGPSGTTSAMDFSVNFQGNTPGNNPLLPLTRAEGSRADVMEATQEATLTGWRNTTYMAVAINELTEAIAENGGPIVDFLLALKGGVQGFMSNGETNTILSILGGLLGGGGIRSILPFSAGGDVVGKAGTSTSDSIPARLSKGEYVINARAAQMLGNDFLDSLNSMGHSFGSGFASPAKAFNRGGSAGGSRGVSSEDVLKLARSKIGAPYVVSADGPDEFDCSGFTEWVYETKLGIPLSEVSYTQVNEHQLVAKAKNASETVDISKARAGDLLFFRTGVHKADPSGLGISHVGIYSGSNTVIHAWGPPLAETNLDNYKSPLVAITRLPLSDAVPASTEGASSAATAASGVGESASYSLGATGMMALGSAPQVTGFGSFTGGSKGLSLGLGRSFSWIAAPLFSQISGGVTSSAAATNDSTSGKPSTGAGDEIASPSASPGSGSGPEWLYKYLVSKGLRGNTLKKAWVIGMRESSGNPNLQSKDKYGGDWNSSGSPYYDVGLYQINNRHLAKVKERYGGDMRQMLDLEKNWDMTTHMSQNWNNLLAWALESDGQTFNWSYYKPMPSWAGASMANHRRLWGEYDQYNVEGYSEGAYRTHEGLAKLHEGEMVLPATYAEQFRKAMRESSVLQPKASPNINITLHIDKASDEEAERFARKVKSYMAENDWFDTVRSR